VREREAADVVVADFDVTTRLHPIFFVKARISATMVFYEKNLSLETGFELDTSAPRVA
jgi:hypothetical protein